MKDHRPHYHFLWLSLFLLSLQHAYASPALPLANTYQQGIIVSDYWVSEKLDGVRAYWNGEQLLSKQGNPYHAPDWFTADFPHHPLDGELWIGRGQYEQLVSTVSKMVPIDSEWMTVRYMVFDLPEAKLTFTERIEKLHSLLTASSPYIKIVKQTRIPNHQTLMVELDRITNLGGEGLMLHHEDALYKAGRSNHLLKVKHYEDAEATVIAHLPGKGKFSGMLGALQVEDDQGRRFRLGSGFTIKERENPPPIGSRVTYKYYGRTSNDLPRFASFLRVRELE